MMPGAMYAAVSGLEAHQTMLDVTANNLANVDTIGYKAQRTTFDSELSELISDGSSQNAQNGGTNPEQVGLGVEVGSVDNMMQAGSLESTGNTLDVAIQGDGFIVVGSSPGTVSAQTGYAPAPSGSTATAITGAGLPTAYQYTQAGNLTTDSQGFLTTTSGQYVMGSTAAGGSPNTYIYIPQGSTNVAIGTDGQVTYTDENSSDTTYGQTVTAGYVSLASFANSAGLTRDSGSDWSASSNSGTAVYGTATTGTFGGTEILSGELEQSNVDMSNEFTNMIEAERGYQANSSVISTADTMMQTLIQMVQ